jgi:hypothetical protein
MTWSFKSWLARFGGKGKNRVPTGVPELDAVLAEGIPAEKLSSFTGYHYDDCELGGRTDIEGCWCEHRGAASHYSGCIKPGWHREDCPRVGIAYLPDIKWYNKDPCECQQFGEGKYILTLQDGTVHGPAPSPMPKREDCIVIPGEEIHKILDGEED